MAFQLVPQQSAGMVSFALEAGAISVSSDLRGTTSRILFSDIIKIHIMQEFPGVFRTNVYHRGEGGPVSIPSRHFVGVGQFEDRRTEYAAFVNELSLAASGLNPRILFVGGSSLLFWVAALNVPTVAFCLWLGVARGQQRGLVAALFLVPLIVAMGRQGRTKSYDPRHPPARWMPPLRQTL